VGIVQLHSHFLNFAAIKNLHMAQIRTATLADLPFLHANNMALAWESESKRLDAATLEKGLHNLLNDPSKGFYIIAEVDGVPAGNLMITVEWSDWRNSPMWWFQSVYLLPEYRGQRIFSAMYAHIRERARAEGVRVLRLYVEKDNVSAQKVYQAMGMAESHYLMYEENL
jgi:GNAT superfamily N-acetyltransferase